MSGDLAQRDQFYPGEDLPLDRELVVRVEPDGPDEDWADLVATLLYKLPDEENSLHGYGCSIEIA